MTDDTMTRRHVEGSGFGVQGSTASALNPEPRTPNPSPRGFTLAESLLASVVLAIAVVGVCSATTASFQQSDVLRQRMTAAALAGQLMEEIAAKPYLDPITGQTTQGNANSTNRSGYDNIGDYGGYSDTSSALLNVQGQAVNLGTALYRRRVAVQYRATFSGASAPTGDFAVVTVTVTQPSGETLVLPRLFTRTALAR